MIGCPVKVSVIVPVYNVEKYLSTCLYSCLNQTLYDIEIICVNDGSTDNSGAILESFARLDHRVVIINKPNGGLSSARNAGMDAASGGILMFLDSDDYLSHNACERVWKEFLEEQTDIITFGTEIFPIKPAATDWHHWTLDVWTHRRWGFEPSVLFREPNAKPFVWRQAFSRKLIEQAGIRFDERVRYGEDIVFQMEIFPHAKYFSFIEDRLYHYRWYREGSLMSSYRTDLDNKIRQHLEFIRYITEYWQEQGWLEKYGKDYTQWLLEFVVRDSRSADAKCEEEHLAALKSLLEEYALTQYLNQVPGEFRFFAKTVEKTAV